MRILFISNDLIAGNIAYILTKEGHSVKLYIEESGRKLNFGGMVKKTEDWRAELKWVGKNGLIVFDDVGFGKIQDTLRKDGYRVFGGSYGGDLLEQSRTMAQNLFHECGMNSLPSVDFINISDAIDFVLKNPGMWVIKQNGKSSKGLNYVGNMDNGKDVVDVLKSYKSNQSIKSEIITLQKKAIGVEIAATRYFNGNRWIGPTLINMEHKKFFPGDLGITTSEMGTLGWYDMDDNNKLFKDTLFKLTDHLRKINYRGIFDINCIVNEDGSFPLEATSRIGSPIVHLQTALNLSSWSEIMYSIANGEDCKIKVNNGYGVVVVVATPPFPYAKKIPDHSHQGVHIYFKAPMSEEDMRNIHFEEVSLDKKNGVHYISDDRGYILYATGTDQSVDIAIKKTYDLIDKIYIPQMFYRNDIGRKFINESREKLKKWGYIK